MSPTSIFLIACLSMFLYAANAVGRRFEHGTIRKRNVGRSGRYFQRLNNPRRQPPQWNINAALTNESDWSRFIPDIPTGDEVDCYVEVEVVHRVGGRCVRLGGQRRMAVCQSGMYLDVHSDICRARMRQTQTEIAASAAAEAAASGEPSEPVASSRGSSSGVSHREHFRNQQRMAELVTQNAQPEMDSSVPVVSADIDD
ncbi:uncharacterized protein LOC127865480 [Dreissena polymorpha]|uniref:Secreted protein n=1 Tax=Dreissena polymorpha TaxID=45954 RepID=A0A9D4M553_DREPO|nr:uncharacterized protein LOC127865480 [Dreissena polymorpha]KAH3869337.1 hypothetical protein DPMN_032500 [Dreissena polymorpha]